MNFITTCFRYSMHKQVGGSLRDRSTIEGMLISVLQDIYSIDIESMDAEKRNELFDELGLKVFSDWAKTYHGLALPVYNVDLCYNLMKRVCQRMYGKENNIIDLQVDDYSDFKLLTEIRSIYKFIEMRLCENDEFYGIKNSGYKSFKTAFVSVHLSSGFCMMEPPMEFICQKNLTKNFVR